MTSVDLDVWLKVGYGDPFGVGTSQPPLSWVVESSSSGWRQREYEVEIDGVSAGRRRSEHSVLTAWPGPPMESRAVRTVRVRVTGEDGVRSGWSAPVRIEAALLSRADWTARFVSAPVPRLQTACLRREFHLAAKPERARLYVTALGVYEVEINGRPVGDHVLAPGWTSYDTRLLYQTFDVTGMLHEGTNAIGATVADGWYRGRFRVNNSDVYAYGDRLALLAQLEWETADGGRAVLGTDGSWRWRRGPTTRASLYDGEDYDPRQDSPGWSRPGFDDGQWEPVDVVERDLETVVAATGPPVRRTATLTALSVSRAPSGELVADFGQNLAGRVRISVTGPTAGVRLRHAEILEDGELCTEPLRTARQTDHLLGTGDDGLVWEPRFTVHGFRYAGVTGVDEGRLAPSDLEAVVCHSDMKRTGWFECSDDRLNRLHENVVWGMRSNFVSIPTDCPQRDERLGWTGDITVFAPAAAFLYDVAGFLASWLRDLEADQNDRQGVPWVVPNVFGDRWIGTAAWGDAAVAVPWTLYQRYGDATVLRRQYSSMVRWTRWVLRMSGADRHWENSFQWGDWLDPAAPPEDPAAGRTDRHLVANAWMCLTLDRMARVAQVLGHHADADTFHRAAVEARRSFTAHYVTPNGRLASDSQTAYTLAICFGLLAEDHLRFAGLRLAELIENDGHTIGTGFVGTPLVCDALCATGHQETAYDLLFQTKAPSWLYPVLLGATTIWERWDGIRPDGGRNPGEMNSFNHYAFGAVADWLHRSVAGLAPRAPGYKQLLVRPLPDRRLDHAWAGHDTPYGRAEAGWARVPDGLQVRATVPANTTALVSLPDGSRNFEVGSGRHEWLVPTA